MYCCKVDRKEGEKVRRCLLDKGLLNREYKIKRVGDALYIPLIDTLEPTLEDELRSLFGNIEFLEVKDEEFQRRRGSKKEMSFREYLLNNFKEEIEKGWVSLSYDVIGSIVILQISEEVDKDTRKKIGENALKLIPSIKTVFRKKSSIEGDYRIRKLELLAGEYNTLTLYKENSYRLWVDVEKVYFSPRLGWERKRIMEMTSPKDVVVDMFCGVGPFSIACRNAKKVYAIDINPYAIELLKRNIELNKVKDKIVPILDDVRNVDVSGNRVIMNLPKYSYKFVDKALDIVEDGGIIHYYTIDKDFKGAEKIFESKCDYEVLGKRIVKSYAPREYVIVLDVKVNKRI
ncbi:SAM-dependent methyltransferase [Methanofervidicoccus sp. A16]|uniref:tRNA (guanine(37)-N1)-methyltransferase Trm5b n=1 Tax=Methanofervidicoccus sp. A16 TaxID=2607662 RepID=UPI001189EFCE|nr:class I SAM-dependent methyltransferase family protein [Methanofervidicoccus sp. A16]AXI24982.1 SAM-dependent methyltransferase [Methanofervidicoccus sp. A16]